MLASIGSTLQGLGLILVVIAIFNVIIFIHELGHFLAARWRGLHVDRFQIWFGKPIWKKTVNGVQYGLGWLPFGGFVALPQMAPMESIEGGNSERKEPLPAVKPIDKIIVAFAGPLFSFLLALTAGLVVWKVGKPKDFIPSTTIEAVEKGSHAEQAGFQSGDTILTVDGEPVIGFAGSLDCISEKIILSKNDKITFTIRREGQAAPLTLQSGFDVAKGSLFQRSGLRDIGISPAGICRVKGVSKDGPADEIGLKEGDVILSIDGNKMHGVVEVTHYFQEHGWKPATITYQRGNETKTATIEPEKPLPPNDKDPKLGILWDGTVIYEEHIVHPSPWEQVTDSVRMMLATISAVASPKSSIGVEQLSGPVGIAKAQFDLLQTPHGWQRLLFFMVLLNVNLAIFNMLPLPVLDGGHITLAVLESIARRPVQARVLEVIQTVFVVALMGLALYVTTKDVGGLFGRGDKKRTEIVFPSDH